MKLSNKYLGLILLISQGVQAVPADWKGSLAFDTNIINDVRRTNDDCTVADGSQCISPEENNARFQTMVLRLNPNIIVNDGVTIRSELSTGTIRNSYLGESTEVEGSDGSYYTQSTNSNLNINQIYAEIYADTALFRVGRFAKHFGLGAVVNRGDKSFDRFYSGYEGVEAELKLGNFHLVPMWAKLHTSDNPNGRYDAYESSIAATYDNPNNNLIFGVYYSQKDVETNDKLYSAGSASVNLIDIYFSKSWEQFSFQLEIPMLSGEVNDLYGTSNASFDANAYILETNYQLNSKWKLGINGGMIKGDDGTTNSFEGMYLNPNYKIAELLFKYNYYGFMDATNYNIFAASMTNATYAQFFVNYSSDEWTWKMSFMWAKANEVASTGNAFFNHDNKKHVANANADQSDDLGYEFDIAFDYQWNPNVVFTGFFGYHKVGDYYAFTNVDGDELSLSNVKTAGMRLAINF